MKACIPSKTISVVICLGTVLGAVTASRGSELERICAFLEKNLMNRTMLMETEGLLSEGSVAYVFRRELTLCNLVRLPAGFQYDAILRITQKNWDVENGQEKGEPRTEDRMLVRRHEFGLRRSTGEFVGHWRTLTATTAMWVGTTRMARLKLQEDQLEITSDAGVYDDHFGPGGTFYPGFSVRKETWFIRDGKLVCRSQLKVYRIDPASLERELLDDGEVTEEQEIGRLPLE